MKTLFLHVGTSKTGTTALQQFFAAHRKLLRKKGFCYPESVYEYPLVSPDRNAHFMVGRIRDKDGNFDKEETERIYKLGMEKLNKCFLEYDNVIMSDENIWRASDTLCKEVWENLKADVDKNGYTVKIIVYLRRQDDFLCSRWNQMVKKDELTETWEEHFRKAPDEMPYTLNYADKIRLIAAIFGKENIIVRRFDRQCFYGGTIHADFLHCVGLEYTDEYKLPKSESNMSIKGNTIEVMRIMNTAPNVNKFNKMYLRRMVSKCSEESDKNYKYTMLTPEEASEFLGRYKEGNEQIAADYIGDGKPLFDYEVGSGLPKWEKNNEYMMEDVVRIFTVITQDLHEEVESLKKKNEDCMKRIAKLENDTKKDFLRMKRIIWKMKHPFRYFWSKITGKELKPNI